MEHLLEWVDLASERVGGAALVANDEYFAEKENLLRPAKAIFIEDKYTDRGKWMDGWESRRKRVAGYDWCIVRLGTPGVVHGFDIDTSFFRGNFPESASVEGCEIRPDADAQAAQNSSVEWFELLPKSLLTGNQSNYFEVAEVSKERRVTHVRLNIFPDGGVARFRVYGEVKPDWKRLLRRSPVHDLAAIENGGRVLTANDMFFGSRHNLVMPGRSKNMGDGWETKRKRKPGHDWCIIQLGARGTLRYIEIDTNYFKGNFPDSCAIEGIDLSHKIAMDHEDWQIESLPWKPVLERTKLQAHTRLFFDEEIQELGPFSHVRLRIFPDGGVSRLRLFGEPILG